MNTGGVWDTRGRWEGAGLPGCYVAMQVLARGCSLCVCSVCVCLCVLLFRGVSFRVKGGLLNLTSLTNGISQEVACGLLWSFLLLCVVCSVYEYVVFLFVCFCFGLYDVMYLARKGVPVARSGAGSPVVVGGVVLA
jgi:hypothetical protein